MKSSTASDLHLRTTNFHSPSLATDIEAILSIQKDLLISPIVQSSSNGFLISNFTNEELRDLFRNGAQVLLAEIHGKIIGYLLLTSINEFTDLLLESTTVLKLSTEINFNNYGYIYQIGISPSAQGAGIGSLLLQETKRTTGKFLLADVLIDPLRNESSIKFFDRSGFINAGELSLASYRNFGRLRSLVFIWK